MRFLTAFFAAFKSKGITQAQWIEDAKSSIEILVNALKSIGADIEYLDKTGYPPLKIKGKELQISKVSLDSNVSSQYITALLLIGVLEKMVRN